MPQTFPASSRDRSFSEPGTVPDQRSPLRIAREDGRDLKTSPCTAPGLKPAFKESNVRDGTLGDRSSWAHKREPRRKAPGLSLQRQHGMGETGILSRQSPERPSRRSDTPGVVGTLCRYGRHKYHIARE